MYSNVVLGVLVYLVTSIFQGCICNFCIKEMQVRCTAINERLMAAEYDHDKEKLCSSLNDLIKCVARTRHECLDTTMETLHKHFESPSNCPLPVDLIREIQTINSSEATTETTVTQAKETASVSFSPDKVTMATNETNPSTNNSSKAEQKGSKANSSTAMSFKVTDLVLLTALGFVLTAVFQRDVLS